MGTVVHVGNLVVCEVLKGVIIVMEEPKVKIPYDFTIEKQEDFKVLKDFVVILLHALNDVTSVVKEIMALPIEVVEKDIMVHLIENVVHSIVEKTKIRVVSNFIV